MTAGDPAASVQDPQGLRRTAARGFLWSAAAFAGTRAAVLASTVILARLLAPADFGVVTAGMTILLYLEVALDLGVGAAVIYEQEKGITPRVQTAFTLNLTLAALLTLAGVAAAPLVATFFHAPGSVGLLRVLFLYLVIRGLTQVPDAVLKRDLRFRARASIDVSRALARLAVSVALAVAGAGAWAIVLGLLAGEATGAALTMAAARFRPSLRIERGAVRSLATFGTTVAALKVVDAVSLDADYVVVGRMLGPTALGFYSIAYRLPELIMFNVYWIFSSVAFPVFSRVASGGRRAFADVMLTALRVITLFGFPAGVGLAIVARDAVVVLFGERWSPAVPALELIALAAALNGIGYASGDIFPALGRPGTLLALNAPVTVATVTALVVVAPSGIAAVAAVHLVGNVGYGFARLVIANRLLGTRLRDAAAALRPGVVCALGAAAAGLPVRLLTDPGPGALMAVSSAVVAGGVAAVALLERPAARELYTLLRSMLSGRRVPSS